MLTNPNKGETAVHGYGPTFISVLVVLVSRKVIFIYVVSTLQLCSKNVCIITSTTESESRDNEICAFYHGNVWFYLKRFFIPVYELKCSYGKISSPVAEIAVRGMTRPARRDLGNRASPLNRALKKRPWERDRLPSVSEKNGRLELVVGLSE